METNDLLLSGNSDSRVDKIIEEVLKKKSNLAGTLKLKQSPKSSETNRGVYFLQTGNKHRTNQRCEVFSVYLCRGVVWHRWMFLRKIAVQQPSGIQKSILKKLISMH